MHWKAASWRTFSALLFLSLVPYALLGAFVESSAALRMRLLEYISAFAPFQTQLLFSKTLDEISASSGAQDCARLFDRDWIASFGPGHSGRPSAGLCVRKPALGGGRASAPFSDHRLRLAGSLVMGVVLYGGMMAGFCRKLWLGAEYHLACGCCNGRFCWSLLCILCSHYRFGWAARAPGEEWRPDRWLPSAVLALVRLRVYLFLVPLTAGLWIDGSVIALLLWLYLTGRHPDRGEVNAECESAASPPPARAMLGSV